MGFPGEELVSKALESFSNGVMKKMDESEARRDREFSYKLKELEFYKGNYDKEIKSVFDRWFDLLQNTLLAGKESLSPEQKKPYQTKMKNSLQADKVIKLYIDTIKYGGTETGKALALFSQVCYVNSKENNLPIAFVYAICVLLSTLKQEILGQEIAPDTILKILLTDYDQKYDTIKDGRDYVEEVRKNLFPEDNNNGAVV
ncbi:MAG: hypothetical protein LUF29_06655 [Oscillospiraceae bacterium]|nr:hypothetical protein [Oscillospiraceae bacterium]